MRRHAVSLPVKESEDHAERPTILKRKSTDHSKSNSKMNKNAAPFYPPGAFPDKDLEDPITHVASGPSKIEIHKTYVLIPEFPSSNNKICSIVHQQ